MNQELTQRVIGAVVVTALAAIFVPMLFDDPVDNSGQVVSELTIPEQPVVIDAPATPPVPSSIEEVATDSGTQAVDNPADTASSLSSQEMNAEPQDIGEEQEFDQPIANAEEPEEPIAVAGSETNKAQPITQAKTSTAKPKVDTSIKPAVGKPFAANETNPAAKTVKTDPTLERWYIQAGSFSKKKMPFPYRKACVNKVCRFYWKPSKCQTKALFIASESGRNWIKNAPWP